MTHRFPHDFWSGRELDVESGYRFDSSRQDGLGQDGPYGFSRGGDWDALAPEDPQEELLRHFIDETVLDEIDADEEPIDDGPHASIVQDLHPIAAPTGLFVPEKYEPNYPYPLIVWFHDQGGNEADLLSLMPRISERNSFGLSLRGLASFGQNSEAGFDWPTDQDALARLEKHLFHTICELRRSFHIHSERVFLAGSGSGARVAIRLLLNRLEWFAGAFALAGELPAFDPKTAAHPEFSERRMFLTMPPCDARQQNARLWRSAGLNLITESEDAAKLSNKRLSQLNRFVMDSICTPV